MRSVVMDGVVRRSRAEISRGAMAPVVARHRPSGPGILDLSTKAVASGMAVDGIATAPAVTIPAMVARSLAAVMPATVEESAMEMVPEVSSEQTATPNERRRDLLRWGQIAMAALLIPGILISGGLAWQNLSSSRTHTAYTQSATQAVPATPQPPKVDPQQVALQNMLASFVAAQGAPMGVVVKDLKSGQTASINADQVFRSASLYKLFVAETVFRQADTGKLALGKQAGGGTGRNVVDCTRIMINISDNACGVALGDMVGWGKQNSRLAASGYTHTDLRTPQQTSAGDVALLLERLYKGTLLSPGSSQQYTQMLKQQRVNNRLPAGLPAGTTMAHKTGDLDGVVHDAGIVYGPKTDYLIVVTSGPWGRHSGQAPASFADLSGKVYAHFNQ